MLRNKMLRKLYNTIMHKVFGLYHHTIIRYRDEWRYIDGYGNIWRLKPTHDERNPLEISLEVVGN